MTNSIMLRELIESKGLKLKYVAERLGISSYGLRLKMDNKNEFKTSEISTLCDLLGVESLELKEKIFLPQRMIINHLHKRKEKNE